jgi:hypothetical protein
MTTTENGTTALVKLNTAALEMIGTVQEALDRLKAMQLFVSSVMREGLEHDYAILPGTARKTLLKPGAEKLCEVYGLVPKYEITRHEDWATPLFVYHVTCRLYRGDRCVGEASASANSRESKYAGRWVPEAEVPDHLDKATLRKKTGARWVFGSELRDRGISHEGLPTQERTSAKTGKPYTVFRVSDTVYFVPNAEIFDTLERMASKRALVGATISVTRSADLFAPDMEDVVENAKAAGKAVDENIPDASFWDEGSPEPATPPPTAADFVRMFGEATTAKQLVELARKANSVKDGRAEMEAAYKAAQERLRPKKQAPTAGDSSEPGGKHG